VFDEFEADIIKAALKNKLFSVNMCKNRLSETRNTTKHHKPLAT